MNSLLALVVIALTAFAVTHPPGVRGATNDPIKDERVPMEPPNRQFLRDYLLPRYLLSQYESKEERIPYPPGIPAPNWLNEEIARINRMEQPPPKIVPHKTELPRWMPHDSYKRIFGPVGPYGTRSHVAPYFEFPKLLPSKSLLSSKPNSRNQNKVLPRPIETTTQELKVKQAEQEKKIFALTPRDEGYFEPTEKDNSAHNPFTETPEGPHEGGGHQDNSDDTSEVGPRRQIRQNPNLSRAKTLVASDLDKLRIGLGSDDADSTGKPRHIHVLGTEFATGSVYAVGIATGIGIAFVLTVLGLILGWYTLTKRAKAAADVEYPAYGVTGPTMDMSGDRKLAHSAQMYHYQHQKQQIIAMERNNVEQRNGSVSDPESEEENEEGDYTVYECPGFATTGEMEVKNPLFNEDPTPATPGKMEVVKPQPKE